MHETKTKLYAIENFEYMIYYLTDKFCTQSIDKTTTMIQLLCGYYGAMFGEKIEEETGVPYPKYLGPVMFHLYKNGIALAVDAERLGGWEIYDADYSPEGYSEEAVFSGLNPEQEKHVRAFLNEFHFDWMLSKDLKGFPLYFRRLDYSTEVSRHHFGDGINPYVEIDQEPVVQKFKAYVEAGLTLPVLLENFPEYKPEPPKPFVSTLTPERYEAAKQKALERIRRNKDLQRKMDEQLRLKYGTVEYSKTDKANDTYLPAHSRLAATEG